MLPIAPSTYYAHKACELDPTLRSARVLRDENLSAEIQRVWDENRKVYGVRKVGSCTAKVSAWHAVRWPA